MSLEISTVNTVIHPPKISIHLGLDLVSRDIKESCNILYSRINAHDKSIALGTEMLKLHKKEMKKLNRWHNARNLLLGILNEQVSDLLYDLSVIISGPQLDSSETIKLTHDIDTIHHRIDICQFNIYNIDERKKYLLKFPYQLNKRVIKRWKIVRKNLQLEMNSYIAAICIFKSKE